MGDHDDPRDREEWEREHSAWRNRVQQELAVKTDYCVFKVRAVPSNEITLTLPIADALGDPSPSGAAKDATLVVMCAGVRTYGILWDGLFQVECEEDDGSCILKLRGGITIESPGNKRSPVLQALNLYPLIIRHGENAFVVAIAPEAIRQIKNATNPVPRPPPETLRAFLFFREPLPFSLSSA